MTENLRPPSSSERPLHGHQYRASTDLSNLQAFHSPLNKNARPSSMIFDSAPKKTGVEGQDGPDAFAAKNSSDWNKGTEAAVFDKYVEDLQQFEKTLEGMASASLDQNFKEELGAIEQWFRVLSEAERTAALYSLLQQATQVQIRFLIMVLQQMTRSDPMSAILSPANFGQNPMQDSMNAVLGQNRPGVPASPSFYRPAAGQALDSSTISQMFPEAALALANQRATLNAKRNGHKAVGSMSNLSSGTTRDTSLNVPIKDPSTPWTPSFRKNKMELPDRPKSAEPTATTLAQRIAGSNNLGTPFRSTRTDLHAESTPYSPYSGAETSTGNWASMTNTPSTAMFPSSLRENNDMNGLGMKLAQTGLGHTQQKSYSGLGVGSNCSPRVVLEKDVSKFRKSSRSGESPGPSMINMPSSPLMMYNEHGDLMTVQQAQQFSSPLVARNGMPLASPRIIGSPALSSFGNGGAWVLQSPNANSYLFAGSSPVIGMHDGYMSDHSQSGMRRARNQGPKPIEDPTDPNLLKDIPQWLRTLRLHKYTDLLKDRKWQEMIKLSDSDLESIGVSALGARRKLLKSFEAVEEALAQGKLQL